jgi:hypothetical protein
MVDGLGGPAAEGGNSGMVQIDQVFGDRKVVAIFAPHRRCI